MSDTAATSEVGSVGRADVRDDGPDLVIDLTDAARARAANLGPTRVAHDRPEVELLEVDRLEVVTESSRRTLTGTVLLVGSSGGHLAQLLSVAPLWDSEHRAFVTFDTDDAVSLLEDERVTWAYHPTTRNIKNLLRNGFLAVKELRRRRPDVVVSTGAAVAFPFFVTARLLRIPTVYVEVYDRVDSPTLTGRLCRPLASVFCVQWPEQLAFYKGSDLVGSLM